MSSKTALQRHRTRATHLHLRLGMYLVIVGVAAQGPHGRFQLGQVEHGIQGAQS